MGNHQTVHLRPGWYGVVCQTLTNLNQTRVLHWLYVPEFPRTFSLRHYRDPNSRRKYYDVHIFFLYVKINCCSLVSLKLENGWADLNKKYVIGFVIAQGRFKNRA